LFLRPAPDNGDAHWSHALYHAMVLLVRGVAVRGSHRHARGDAGGHHACRESGRAVQGRRAIWSGWRDITCLALDKTGTITEGKPSVVAVCRTTVQASMRVLELAVGVEQHSEHLFAQAILNEAKARRHHCPDVAIF